MCIQSWAEDYNGDCDSDGDGDIVGNGNVTKSTLSMR